jgi:TonB family protein
MYIPGMTDGGDVPSRATGIMRTRWRPIRRVVLLQAGVALLYLTGLGCSERARPLRSGREPWWTADEPDVVPQMLNEELPFRYPVALYAQRVQGNVLLRLHVDAAGRVVPDSTRLLETSGYPALDSAALAGATRLRFQAARRRGLPVAVSMLFPVHYRHPDGPRLPGDSL